MPESRFVTTGGLRMDYLITRDGSTHNGLPGGNALYAAAGASYWINNVALWARYGDNFPRPWLDDLQRFGLDTQGLVNVPGHHDHRTFYAYSAAGVRDDTDPAAHYARFNHPLPEALTDYIHSTPRQDDPDDYEPLAVRPEDWPASFDGVTAVHLSPLPLATHLHIPPAIRHHGVRQISIDPGERYMVPNRVDLIRQILPAVDIFLPSDQEVRSLFGDEIELEEAAQTFLSWGASLVVIKIGEQGVLLQGKADDQLLHLRPYHKLGDERVIDVTGAGDAFCGGFMVGLAKTADPIQAAQMGLVSASLVIEGYGALYALNVAKGEAQRRLGEFRS